MRLTTKLAASFLVEQPVLFLCSLLHIAGWGVYAVVINKRILTVFQLYFSFMQIEGVFSSHI